MKNGQLLRQVLNVRLSFTIQSEYLNRGVFNDGEVGEFRQDLNDGIKLYSVDRELAEEMLADAECQIAEDGRLGPAAIAQRGDLYEYATRNAYKALIAQLRKRLAR